jgi:hypothetical protein
LGHHVNASKLGSSEKYGGGCPLRRELETFRFLEGGPRPLASDLFLARSLAPQRCKLLYCGFWRFVAFDPMNPKYPEMKGGGLYNNDALGVMTSGTRQQGKYLGSYHPSLLFTKRDGLLLFLPFPSSQSPLTFLIVEVIYCTFLSSGITACSLTGHTAYFPT